jgi:hypothetical protein
MPPQVRTRRTDNGSGIMIVSSHPKPTMPSLTRRATCEFKAGQQEYRRLH